MNRFLNSLIHCNNMAVASAKDTKRSTEMLRTGLIELKQIMHEKEITDTDDSHSIGDCCSGTANHDVSQYISIDRVPLPSFCNHNDDCTTTGGIFSFFDKALTVSINQTMTDQLNELSNEILMRLATVLVYNLGLFHHCSVLSSTTNIVGSKQADLQKALNFYQMALTFPSEGGFDIKNSDMILIFALHNNMGHIYSIQNANSVQSQDCFTVMQSILQENDAVEFCLSEEEYLFFLKTITLYSDSSMSFAAAAA